MEKRDAVSNETRLRILEAAREILAQEAETSLSMDAIARRADVSRLTIYYQFKSRPGLFEALYDYLATRGDMRRMAEVFHEPDPYLALEKLVSVFVGFWASDRIVIRRLRAIAALDPEVSEGIQSRDARRRHITGEILMRIAGKKKYSAEQMNSAADLITMLTGFATYDSLAAAGHSKEEITRMIHHLVRFTANS